MPEGWSELTDEELLRQLEFVLSQSRSLMNERVKHWHEDIRPRGLARRIVEHLALSGTRAFTPDRGVRLPAERKP